MALPNRWLLYEKRFTGTLGRVRARASGWQRTKLSRIKVLATIAAERLADGVAISLMFGVLLTFFARAHEVEESKGLYLVAYGFLFVALITALVIYKRNFAYRILDPRQPDVRPDVALGPLSRVAFFIEGLEPLLHLRSFLIIFGALHRHLVGRTFSLLLRVASLSSRSITGSFGIVFSRR